MSDTTEQRVAAAVSTTASAAGEMITARDARIAELEGEVLHWRTEATDATRIMNRRGEHVRELKVRIAELEEQLAEGSAQEVHTANALCGAPCPHSHDHTCARSPKHLGPHRDVKQKGDESCSWTNSADS